MGTLIFLLWLGAAFGGMLLFGLIVNVLLFPGMWRQSDVPAAVRWLAGDDVRRKP
jgi:hypothetical protein